MPLVFLVAALALLVPLGAHASSLAFGGQGVIPRVYAIVVPVFIGLTLMLFLLVGARNALVAASFPIAAGLLTALVALVSLYAPVFVPEALLPPAGDALAAGLSTGVGALAALFAFHGLSKLEIRNHVAWLFVPAVLVGTGIQGIALFGASQAGMTLTDVVWPAIAAVPVLVGSVPTVFLGLFTSLQTHKLDPEGREELLRQAPFGGDSMVEAYARAEKLYKKGVIHGRQVASKYLELLDSQPVGTYVCDGKGRIRYANAALAELLGYRDEDLDGQSITHLMANVSQQGRPVPAQQALEPGHHRITIRLPNGRPRPLDLKVERTSERRLRGHVTDLTHEVVRMELERQKQQAALYLDLLSRGVAGHLESPLTLLERMDPEAGRLPPDTESIQEARRDLGEIRALIDHVDLLARLDHLEPEPVDASALVEAAADRARERLGNPWQVGSAGPEQPVLLRATPMVGEALDILVDRAAHHGEPADGLELEVTSRGAVGWVLCVRYVGDPPPSSSAAVLEGEASPDEDGGALGFYAVHSLAAALGGWARVETGALRGVGREVVFSLHLPTAPVDPAAWRARGIGPSGQPAEA